MTGNIRVFLTSSMKEAFMAGRKSAESDPLIWKEIFDAGQKKGAGWMNEAINSPGYIELMAKKRGTSPGSWKSWIRRNETRLSSSLCKEEFDLASVNFELNDAGGKKLITMDAIEEVVRFTFNTSIDSLRYGIGRFNHIKKPRYFAFYLAYFHVYTRLLDMGLRWGGKNHATVIHGARCISKDALLYKKDMEILTLLYRRLAKKGYDISHFVQEDNVRKRNGAQRLSVKPIEINL